MAGSTKMGKTVSVGEEDIGKVIDSIRNDSDLPSVEVRDISQDGDGTIYDIVGHFRLTSHGGSLRIAGMVKQIEGPIYLVNFFNLHRNYGPEDRAFVEAAVRKVHGIICQYAVDPSPADSRPA